MKDYKTGAVTSHVRSHRSWLISIATISLLLLIAWFISNAINGTPKNVSQTQIQPKQALTNTVNVIKQVDFIEPTPIHEITMDKLELVDVQKSQPTTNLSVNQASILEIPLQETVESASTEILEQVTVKTGDSLALIFSRLGLSPRSLYNIMSLGKDVSRLKKLRPGQKLNFSIDEKQLIKLEYEINLTNTLLITKSDDKFQAELIEIELESRTQHAKAIINDSLFLSGKRAGLSDNLIMQLVSIYGWDIDFALDIREGDSFTLIYEEQYKDGVKVSDGPIIAAEFINRNSPLRAIRYTHDDGRTDYYADNGDAMRKAFLRTPVELARISSRFNLKRKHPILNKIRAHKGVDYAASTGTPIKATGDGTVVLAGKKGGYGKTVVLKHGGKYSTLYAHLHKYARGVRTGKRVKQGQVIGYVGKSGLATGPHLHYEFRVNGVHRNPLTVKLPKVESIDKRLLPSFKEAISPMIAELDRITGKRALAVQAPQKSTEKINLVMEDG